MKKNTIFFLAILTVCFVFAGCSNKKTDQFAEPEKGETVAEIVIENHGSIFVKFFEEEAPKAVENFITHSRNGYYDGLTFHRIIEDFMIQGGDPTGTGAGGESIWGTNFEDEFDDDLQPYHGALCMANAGPGTNGSQFFLVQSDEPFNEEDLKNTEELVKKGMPPRDIKFNEGAIKNYGEFGGTPWLFGAHTVFGQVYDGLDVLDEVAAVEKLDPQNGIPQEEVVIETIKVFEY